MLNSKCARRFFLFLMKSPRHDLRFWERREWNRKQTATRYKLDKRDITTNTVKKRERIRATRDEREKISITGVKERERETVERERERE